jgi:IS1 transposase
MTGIAVLKKAAVLQHANPSLLPPPRSRSDRALPGCAAEVDERWSFVGAKDTTRWLWHASDHHTGRVLAYVVGPWKDAVFWILKALLASFGITRYYTDKASVYLRHLLPAQHPVGKLTM